MSVNSSCRFVKLLTGLRYIKQLSFLLVKRKKNPHRSLHQHKRCWRWDLPMFYCILTGGLLPSNQNTQIRAAATGYRHRLNADFPTLQFYSLTVEQSNTCLLKVDWFLLNQTIFDPCIPSFNPWQDTLHVELNCKLHCVHIHTTSNPQTKTFKQQLCSWYSCTILLSSVWSLQHLPRSYKGS